MDWSSTLAIEAPLRSGLFCHSALRIQVKTGLNLSAMCFLNVKRVESSYRRGCRDLMEIPASLLWKLTRFTRFLTVFTILIAGPLSSVQAGETIRISHGLD